MTGGGAWLLSCTAQVSAFQPSPDLDQEKLKYSQNVFSARTMLPATSAGGACPTPGNIGSGASPLGGGGFCRARPCFNPRRKYRISPVIQRIYPQLRLFATARATPGT